MKTHAPVHPHAKLTPTLVQRIRRSWHAKEHKYTLRALAARYGVAIPTISHVVYGLTWKSVVSHGQSGQASQA